MQYPASPRLILRPLEPPDATAVFAIFGDREVMRYSLRGPLISRAQCRAFIEENRRREARLGFSFWGVVERAGGALVGTCGLAEFGFAPGGIELAYRLRRDRWGRGYATEAARATLAHAFGPLGMERVLAAVEPANTASVRVIEKCGFALVETCVLAGREARLYALRAAEFAAGGAGQSR